MNLGSALAWVDGTSDFLELVDPTDTSNMFEVTFNTNLVSIQAVSGDFADWFSVNQQIDLPEDSIKLMFEENPLPGTPPAMAVYTVVEEGVFDFTDALPAGAVFPKTGETVEQLKFVVPVGTQFLLNDLTPNNVDISLCTSTCEEVPFWMTNDGKIDFAISGLGFKDDPAGGTYDASSGITKPVPEPGTVFGILSLVSFGLSLKHKKQNKQLTV